MLEVAYRQDLQVRDTQKQLWPVCLAQQHLSMLEIEPPAMQLVDKLFYNQIHSPTPTFFATRVEKQTFQVPANWDLWENVKETT